MLLTARFIRSSEIPEIELFKEKCSLEVTKGHPAEGGAAAESGL